MTTKDQVKELWHICFEDDDEAFVDMYFRLRYTDERNVAVRQGERMISALQMIPYPMTFCGHTVQTSYISGACTHPDFRGKGVMRNLLTLTFARMWNDGTLFSTLIPAEMWLFGYYESAGYATAFRYEEEPVTPPRRDLAHDIETEIVSDYQEEIYHYLNSQLSERPCCIQHTATDFRVILADLTLSDGCLFVAKRENNIAGIAITYRKDGQLFIHELFAEDEEVEHCLLAAIHRYDSNAKMVRLMPYHTISEPLPLGMARIINAKEVLQMYAAAFPGQEMRLKLSDEQLPQNDGYYHIYKGICTYSAAQMPLCDFEPIDIKELTCKVLSPLKPYMSLMIN